MLTLLLASTWPQTEAEVSNYQHTTSHAQVLRFLDDLVANQAPMRVSTMGVSEKGRKIPLCVVANDPTITPARAHAEGRLVVYIQANIHAGEVEGKEATLMILREWAQSPKQSLLRNAVLVVAPIYNCDGNDAWGPALRNRGHQDGPDPVGERANGQGLDLNRDCTKAESPEFRAVLSHVYGEWNPHVVFDLHTTNGTRHGFLLTYSPGLNPTSDPKVRSYSQDLLAEVRRATTAWKLFDYGDASMMSGKQVFATFAAEPRYVTNYAGVRNRVAILSEAASFQPFKDRVTATRQFVLDCLSRLERDRKKIIAMEAKADSTDLGGTQVGVDYAPATVRTEDVPLEDGDPANPIPPNKAPIKYKKVSLPIYDRFSVTKSAPVPKEGWVIPAERADIARLVARHGIAVRRIEAEKAASAARFHVTDATVASGAFQGHRLVRYAGSREIVRTTLRKGDYFVPTRQPLALLAFHLLCPESSDGVAAWGMFGEGAPEGGVYPILELD